MPKKILVADDDRAITRLVQVNLKRAGYTVVTVFNGKDALEQVAAENPDLVILAARMPYMDGFEVRKNLRKNQSTRDLRVIILTEKAPEADVVRGWQSAVDCYLTKPFHPIDAPTNNLLTLSHRVKSSHESQSHDPLSRR